MHVCTYIIPVIIVWYWLHRTQAYSKVKTIIFRAYHLNRMSLYLILHILSFCKNHLFYPLRSPSIYIPLNGGSDSVQLSSQRFCFTYHQCDCILHLVRDLARFVRSYRLSFWRSGYVRNRNITRLFQNRNVRALKFNPKSHTRCEMQSH